MEIWKDIYFIDNDITYDYRGLYQVSNLGKIKSLHYNKEKILKGNKIKGDYFVVKLYKNNTQKYFLIHRLVAFHFVDGYFNGAEVDHIVPVSNGGNNFSENLRWVNKRENLNNPSTKNNHSYSSKGSKNPNFGNKGKDNSLSKVFIGINVENNEVLKFDSAGMSEENGFIATHIIQCSLINLLGYEEYKKTHITTRKTPIHKGYNWFYEEDYIKKFGDVNHE